MKIPMESPAGAITLETDGRGGIVDRIQFGASPETAEQDPGATMRISGSIQALITWLHEYTSGIPGGPLPVQALNLSACTPFQRRVYQATLDVPYGQTTTYSEIARRIGSPNSARAVGQALGRNPFPIAIPCHRVLAADGGLGGYLGGLPAKSTLLSLEVRRSS